MRKEILSWLDNTGKGVNMMFDQHKVAQEFFNMSKNYWTTTVQMLGTIQEQNEKMLTTLMDHGMVAQQEGKKMFQEWLNRAHQARDQFQKTMEDNLKKAESIFGTTGKIK